MESFECYTTRSFPPIFTGEPSDDPTSKDSRKLYEVRIIDNDYNTYQQVIDVTMAALKIDEEQAFAIAWEVDHSGSCVVAVAPHETAEAIAEVIRTIGIEVQVNELAKRA